MSINQAATLLPRNKAERMSMKTARHLFVALGATAVLSGAAVVANSPIADAAMRRDVAAVRKLIQQGAKVNEPQGDGMTALHWASEYGDATMAQLLLRAGAKVTAVTRIGSYTPLHLASKAGSAPVVQALIRREAT
jgi:ankyrin repeat protein